MVSKCNHWSADAKHRIIIQRPVETTDDYGGRTVSWSNVGTYWASMQPYSGREVFSQSATQSRITHKAVIRYQSGLKNIANISDYRVSFDDRLFAVQAIRNLDNDMKSEGRVYQEISLEENAPDVEG